MVGVASVVRTVPAILLQNADEKVVPKVAATGMNEIVTQPTMILAGQAGAESVQTTYGRIVDAVEGRLVIWPAYWTHIHCGIVSKTQTKYIATGWFEFD